MISKPNHPLNPGPPFAVPPVYPTGCGGFSGPKTRVIRKIKKEKRERKREKKEEGRGRRERVRSGFELCPGGKKDTKKTQKQWQCVTHIHTSLIRSSPPSPFWPSRPCLPACLPKGRYGGNQRSDTTLVHTTLPPWHFGCRDSVMIPFFPRPFERKGVKNLLTHTHTHTLSLLSFSRRASATSKGRALVLWRTELRWSVAG